MKVVIELPKVEDFKRVNELARQVHELHVKWRPDIFSDINEIIRKDNLEEMIQNKEIYVAKLQNQILGYIIFNIKENSNPGIRCRKQLTIKAICVDENNRRKGIGKLLLEHAKNIAQDNHCTDMNLTVNQENTNAIKLYEEFGFKLKNIAYSMKL